MTFTVPIPSHSHEVIPIPIPPIPIIAPYSVFPFPLFPDTTIHNIMGGQFIEPLGSSGSLPLLLLLV